MIRRPQAMLAMSPDVYTQLFDWEQLQRLEALAELGLPRHVDTFSATATRARLRQVEVLVTGWGCPPLEHDVIRDAPNLRAVIHTAGTVKDHVTQACWDRGLIVTSAAEANAIPVAEYTLSAILSAGKRINTYASLFRSQPGTYASRDRVPEASNYQRTVGIIGFSRTGRRVVRLLRPFDVDVLVADPYADPDGVAAAGAILVSLEDLLRISHTVSLHAPALPSTANMIDAKSLALMPDHATLINTSRGSLVDTEALTRECVSGRLFAFLDVTEPEPLPADSPLYHLPNVTLTPHIAGATHNETRRLAQLALDELARFSNGLPLRHQIHRSSLNRIA